LKRWNARPRELTVPADGGPMVRDLISTAELDRATLQVLVNPMPTVFTVTVDAVQGGPLGTPANWRRTVASSLRARDRAALAPFADPRMTGWPSILDDVHASEPFDHALQRLMATRGADLTEALSSDRDVAPGVVAWNPMRRDPDRWLRGYVDAIHRAWAGLAPLWRRASALLEREAERLASALDQGVPVSQLVVDVTPRATLRDETLGLASRGPEARPLDVDPSGVRVAPMITGLNVWILATPCDALSRLSYPIPAAWRVFDDRAPPPASLKALLGIPRTELLRRLDQPQTAGALASAVGLGPSGATFHLRALEAAGLVVRERHGRHVIVARTGRGTQLLGLYAHA
jgi:DNA-binding transcriptional ArsR family regulator